MGGRTGRRPATVTIYQQRVSCLKCRAHWWIDETGHEKPGPAFSPYVLTTVQGKRQKTPAPTLADLEPTGLCQCAPRHRFIDYRSQLIEHRIVATHLRATPRPPRNEPDHVTAKKVQPSVIELPLRFGGIIGDHVGRVVLNRYQLAQAAINRAPQYEPLSKSEESQRRRFADDMIHYLEARVAPVLGERDDLARGVLNREQLTQAIIDGATKDKPLSKSEESQYRQFADDMIHYLEAEVAPLLGDWFTDFALWDAKAANLDPARTGDPKLFLEFLESHPDGINLLSVPAVQRAVRWIRLECRKPDKERLGRWLGGTTKDHRPVRLDRGWIQRIYPVFQEQLARALKFTQRCREQGDDADRVWLKVVKECRVIMHRVQRAGLRREFLRCAEMHGKRRGGLSPLNNLAHRLVAHETGATLDYVRRLVKRGIKGEG